MALFSRELARERMRDADFQGNNRASSAEEGSGSEKMFAGMNWILGS